jgi:beta-mannosidase
LTTTKLSADFSQAELDVALTLEGAASDVTLELYSPDGTLLESQTLYSKQNKGLQKSLQQQVSSGHLRHDDNGILPGVKDSSLVPTASGNVRSTFKLEHPQLWYPHGYGAQPLYKLAVKVADEIKELKLGFRDVQIVQQSVAGETGSSFFFKVNGIEMFIGGANWIPDDILLNRISDERYRERITQALHANMTMLRVWGGGIYDSDIFYDIYDELGVLVWQDFLFACRIYPAYPEFLESVKREAEANVKRLRHHTCIALWCGNNEDYQIAESVGQYGEKGDANKFEALEIYEKLLPDVCKRLDPTRFYWPGSPYGGPNSFDPTIGDRHT